MWDLIVIGLGPAGSTAARIAAQNGLKILGLDSAKFPRYKVCAAGLTGRAEKLLPLPPERYREKSVRRIRITLRGRNPIIVESTDVLMSTTRRETLDAALLNLASDAGAVIREGCRVDKVCVGKDGIRVYSDGMFETARYVIGCDGANSIVRRVLSNKRPAFLPAWEVEFQLPAVLDSETGSEVRFDIGLARRGYGWVFPKNETLSVGVAGVFRSRAEINMAFESISSSLPGVSGWRVLHQGGHPVPVYRPSDRMVEENGLILAGDAAGLVDPFLGEGLYYALKSGEIAGEWVSQKATNARPDIGSYRSLIEKKLGPDLSIASRLAKMVYRFPGLFFYMARRHPDVLKRFSESLSDQPGYLGFIRRLPPLWKLFFLDQLKN